MCLILKYPFWSMLLRKTEINKKQWKTLPFPYQKYSSNTYLMLLCSLQLQSYSGNHCLSVFVRTHVPHVGQFLTPRAQP